MTTVESLNAATQLASVRLVSTANISGVYYNGFLNNGINATFTVAAGVLVIDNVTVNVGDFVLLTDQTLKFQNGIYQCIKQGTALGLSAILQRRGDFQCLEQMKAGQYLSVTEGQVNEGSIWTLVNPLPAAIGFSATTSNDINFISSGSGSSPSSTTWIDVTSTPKALLPGHGFLTDNGAVMVTYVLPLIMPFGTIIEIQGMSAGLFQVTQNAGQQITFGNQNTTLGVGGSLVSTNTGDYLKLLCLVDNTLFAVIGGVGNFTVI